MSGLSLLFLALLLDAAFGEPDVIWKRIPHPTVLFGRLIGWADMRFNQGNQREMKGAVLIGALVFGGFLVGFGIELIPYSAPVVLLIAAVLLAQRSLAGHVQHVAEELQKSDLEGQIAVAKIVGRDTRSMKTPDISRAAIESAAENLSDGVIAPVFWFAVLGLPGLLVCKLVNTADSMIAHKTPRHQQFGWATAKVDTVINYVPARLTALLILAATWTLDRHKVVLRDAPNHRSVNAGWPEAAMAVGLNVALSGPRSYGGKITEQPWLNPEGRRDPGADDVDGAVMVLWRVWAIALTSIGLLALIF